MKMRDAKEKNLRINPGRLSHIRHFSCQAAHMFGSCHSMTKGYATPNSISLYWVTPLENFFLVFIQINIKYSAQIRRNIFEVMRDESFFNGHYYQATRITCHQALYLLVLLKCKC